MTNQTTDAAVERGPFHVSRSSDGETSWFSARDSASGVIIPAKDRDDAYNLVHSLNRACDLYARLRAEQAEQKLADAVRLLERARLNTKPLYVNWHHDMKTFLAALRSAASGEVGE